MYCIAIPSVHKEPFYLSFQSDTFVMSLLFYKTICIIVVVLFRVPKNGGMRVYTHRFWYEFYLVRVF